MIALKAIELDDLKRLHGMYRGTGYENFFRHFPEHLSLEKFEQFSLIMGGFVRAVEEDTGVVRGYALARSLPEVEIAECSVLVPVKYQAHGYALAIVKEIAKYTFEVLGYNRLVFIVLEDDNRTNALLAQGHCTKEGVMLQTAKVGKLVNEVRWSLDKQTYNQQYLKGNQ